MFYGFLIGLAFYCCALTTIAIICMFDAGVKNIFTFVVVMNPLLWVPLCCFGLVVLHKKIKERNQKRILILDENGHLCHIAINDWKTNRYYIKSLKEDPKLLYDLHTKYGKKLHYVPFFYDNQVEYVCLVSRSVYKNFSKYSNGEE